MKDLGEGGTAGAHSVPFLLLLGWAAMSQARCMRRHASQQAATGCFLQVLVGWTAMSQPRQRIVLSFRGTASMQNLLSDFQVGDSCCLLKRRLKPTPSLPC